MCTKIPLLEGVQTNQKNRQKRIAISATNSMFSQFRFWRNWAGATAQFFFLKEPRSTRFQLIHSLTNYFGAKGSEKYILPVSPFSTVPKPEQPVACFSLLSEIVHARLTRRHDVRRSRSTSKRKGKCQELLSRSKNARNLMIKQKNHQEKCF